MEHLDSGAASATVVVVNGLCREPLAYRQSVLGRMSYLPVAFEQACKRHHLSLVTNSFLYYQLGYTCQGPIVVEAQGALLFFRENTTPDRLGLSPGRSLRQLSLPSYMTRIRMSSGRAGRTACSDEKQISALRPFYHRSEGPVARVSTARGSAFDHFG